MPQINMPCYITNVYMEWIGMEDSTSPTATLYGILWCVRRVHCMYVSFRHERWAQFNLLKMKGRVKICIFARGFCLFPS